MFLSILGISWPGPPRRTPLAQRQTAGSRLYVIVLCTCRCRSMAWLDPIENIILATFLLDFALKFFVSYDDPETGIVRGFARNVVRLGPGPSKLWPGVCTRPLRHTTHLPIVV